MRINYFMYTTIISIVVLTACSKNEVVNTDNAPEEWAFAFAALDGYIYQISDEYVKDISKELGEVTTHMDVEGTYAGNFSNVYEKGTKYYSIDGISIKEAIAIKEANGTYRKAVRNDKGNEE
ncbi:hypothetical protein ACIQZG_18845 [Lysinibacillus sp. NPDC096418]|uniref:hypothetical protein n=1 Tax=Lysinibacillus sp. NPDC096418 TaxID=3364138 RepID=UPI003816E215